MKQISRFALVFTFGCAVLGAFSNLAHAQKIDLAFGVSTMIAPSASFSNGTETLPSLTGGTYPGFSGDVLFWKNVGVGAEVFWKASQAGGFYADNFGVNYRPVLYNFNAIYSPKIASHVYAELVGGVGAMSTHFFECSDCQQFGGSQEVASSSHFTVDLGGGLKIYPKGGFFIRPEARYYWINNNTNFSGSYTTRVGASIGYTFGGK